MVSLFKKILAIILAFVFGYIIFSYIEYYYGLNNRVSINVPLRKNNRVQNTKIISYLMQITVNPTPTPTKTPAPTLLTPSSTKNSEPNIEWGVAKKVDEHTYTIQVGQDNKMATPNEVVDAINSYRRTHGVGSLSWDNNLGNFSQQRADYFKSIGQTDKHAGFNNFLDNENGFDQLGFKKLGENSYFGVKLESTHLIEWVFAQSPEHNKNQLDPSWTHIGVGTNGKAVNIVFGAK